MDQGLGLAEVSEPGVDDFRAVAEIAGVRITREALAMQVSRYGFAASLCYGKDVLEVACGSGFGLGYLANKGARRVVGGDLTESLIRDAASHYKSRVALLRLDAHGLPFRNASFDLIVLYEAIYYLRDARRFVAESARVLRQGGQLIICTANKECAGFNPSPYSTSYYSARELGELLSAGNFQPRIYVAFPAVHGGLRGRVVAAIKRAAVSANLIPKTMKAKEPLKRFFLGPLTPVPRELSDDLAGFQPPALLDELSQARRFKILYAVGRRC